MFQISRADSECRGTAGGIINVNVSKTTGEVHSAYKRACWSSLRFPLLNIDFTRPEGAFRQGVYNLLLQSLCAFGLYFNENRPVTSKPLPTFNKWPPWVAELAMVQTRKRLRRPLPAAVHTQGLTCSRQREQDAHCTESNTCHLADAFIQLATVSACIFRMAGLSGNLNPSPWQCQPVATELQTINNWKLV